MVELAGPGWLGEPELLGVIPWKTGALGSLVAGWDGELEVDVPLGFVVGNPPWKTGAFGSELAGWEGELVGVNGFT